VDLIADASPTGDALTFVFPVAAFIGVLLWGFFSRKGRER
jgi:LPXTG-motif cell wall-anchored protein